jgi:hypothetical protein
MYNVQETRIDHLYISVEGAVPMFMVVSFPWPVPSANVALTGHVPAPDQLARVGARQRGWLRPALAGANRTR